MRTMKRSMVLAATVGLAIGGLVLTAPAASATTAPTCSQNGNTQ